MTIRKPFFVVPMDFTLVPYFSTPMSGYPQENLAKFNHVGLAWRDPATPSAFFGADLGAAKEVDFFAALNSNAQVGAVQNFTLRSGASPGGASVYTTGAVPFASSTGQSPYGFVHSFFELPTPHTARYFEYVVGGHTGELQISHFVIGKKIEFDRFYDQGFGKGFEGFDAPAINAGGVPDIQTSAILRGLKFAFSTMSKDDFHSKFQPLVVALKDHRPVYICFDPQADQYRQSNTYFGWLRKPQFATIGATHPDWYSQELEILSQI